jgi:hypothetical protein
MSTEALRLFVVRTVLVVEVEPRLADAYDLGVARGFYQPIRRALPLLLRLVRMNTNRTPDVAVALGYGPDTFELVESGADRQHAGHPCRPGAGEHPGFVASKLGKVEMAMAVDQHVSSPQRPVRRSVGTRLAAWAASFRRRVRGRTRRRSAPRPAQRADRGSCPSSRA